MGEVKKRKIRSDKKQSIKPTVDVEIYECIARINHITRTPMKDVGEYICQRGMFSKKVMDHLSKYFRFNLSINNVAYIGNPDHVPERSRKRKAGETLRLDLRFKQEFADKIKTLAYALDRTPSTATAMLLEAAIKSTDIVDDYLNEFMDEVLDDARKKELKQVVAFINKNNPYKEEITLGMLLNDIFVKAADKTVNARIAVDDFLNSIFDDGED